MPKAKKTKKLSKAKAPKERKAARPAREQLKAKRDSALAPKPKRRKLAKSKGAAR